MRKLIAALSAWFSYKPKEDLHYAKLTEDELHVLLHYGPELLTCTFHLSHYTACISLCEKGLLIMEEDKVKEMTLSLTQLGADWLRHYYRGPYRDRFIDTPTAD